MEKTPEAQREDSIQALLLGLLHQYMVSGFWKFKDLGIHPGQLPILKMLEEKEGVSQRELADLLQIKPPTVTVAVRRLEKADLVWRKSDQRDQRVSRIYLTDKGKHAAGRLHTLAEEMEQVFQRGFTESELCLMKRFLKQMKENLKQEKEQEERTEHD